MVIVWIFAVLLILYLVLLLLLRCRKGNETWAKLKPQRYAHRGYHDKPTIPENSMPAFRRAIEHGWGAELDVHQKERERTDDKNRQKRKQDALDHIPSHTMNLPFASL